MIGNNDGNEGGRIKEFRQSFAAIARIHGSVHEFAQVLDTGKRIRCGLFFELLDVSDTVDEELQDLRDRRRTALGTEALDGRLRRFARGDMAGRFVGAKGKTNVFGEICRVESAVVTFHRSRGRLRSTVFVRRLSASALNRL